MHWSGIPIPLVVGSVPLERAAPRRYSLSSREVPSALSGEQQFDWKAAVQELPAQAGIDLANWKVVRRFVEDRFGLALRRSSCLNYPRLHGGRLCTGWGLC